MATYTQYFFIEGKLLGTTPRGLVFSHEQRHPAYSDMVYCQWCGEVYAKCPVMNDQTGEVQLFRAFPGICRKCTGRRHLYMEVEGSVYRQWDYDYTEALPVPVLRWELQRHIEWYERRYLT